MAGLKIAATASPDTRSTAMKATAAVPVTAPAAMGRDLLPGMDPVRLQIPQVVEDVDGARDETENDHGDKAPRQEAELIDPHREEEGEEDDEVLHPVPDPQEPEIGVDGER